MRTLFSLEMYIVFINKDTVYRLPGWDLDPPSTTFKMTRVPVELVFISLAIRSQVVDIHCIHIHVNTYPLLPCRTVSYGQVRFIVLYYM